jgi:DNA-binding NtrC family response regulator
MLHFIHRLKELTNLRVSRRPRPKGHDGNARPDVREMRLLAVTEDARMWDSLRDIAERAHGWRLFRARSCEEAIAALEKDTIGIVIYDRDLPGGDWRGDLLRISSSRIPVCIFLASPVADDYLWIEVVRHHGFDILPRPFQAERVMRAVSLASSWGGWASRPVPDGHPKPAA